MFYTCYLIISLAVVPKQKTRTPKKPQKVKTKQKHQQKYPHKANKKQQQKAVTQLHTCLSHYLHALTGISFFKVKFQSAVSYSLHKTIFYCKLKNLQ